MDKELDLPRDSDELKEREAAGLWQAISHSRKLAEQRDPITLESVFSLHKILLERTLPTAAGRFRREGEDVKKLNCIEPPPGRIVEQRVFEFWKEFDLKISAISFVAPTETETFGNWLDSVFNLATWTQHKIAAIHPFCDGNGRISRLLTNMILLRFGLPPSRVKIEAENKPEYWNALCQIDKQGDYEPLKNIIIKGSLETLEKEEKRRLEAQRNQT